MGLLLKNDGHNPSFFFNRYRTVKHIISLMKKELISALVENYKNNQLTAINGTLGIQDAEAISFDLPKLKGLISEIEAQSDDDADDLAIKFQYATYPKAENWDIMEGTGVPVEYAGLHTLIMIPTINGKEVDKSRSKEFAFSRRMMEMDDSLIAENHGQLIPPRGGGLADNGIN